MIEVGRRPLITGLMALVAAPAIVKVSSLMPVKPYFVSDVQSNTIIGLNEISREAVRLFSESNVFLRDLYRQYDGQFAEDGARIGQMLRIRLPADFTVQERYNGFGYITKAPVAPPVEVVAPFALAAAAVAVAPEVLAKPVTRRFWGRS